MQCSVFSTYWISVLPGFTFVYSPRTLFYLFSLFFRTTFGVLICYLFPSFHLLLYHFFSSSLMQNLTYASRTLFCSASVRWSGIVSQSCALQFPLTIIELPSSSSSFLQGLYSLIFFSSTLSRAIFLVTINSVRKRSRAHPSIL